MASTEVTYIPGNAKCNHSCTNILSVDLDMISKRVKDLGLIILAWLIALATFFIILTKIKILLH
jgi:hypothetical protein